MYYSLDELVVGKLEYGSGASAIPYDGVTRYIRITDIDDDGNLNKDPMTPSAIDEKYILNDGDVLFARTGATVGKTYKYIPVDGRCIYAGYLIRAIPNQHLIRPDYLWLFTKSPQYWQFIRNSMKVVAQPNINAKQYGSMKIYVPSLEEQDAILSTLLYILGIINKRKKQLQAFDTLIKARFVEMFGDMADPSCKWPLSKLIATCDDKDDIKCGPFGTQLSKDEYQESGIPVWEIPQINSAFTIAPEHFLTIEKAEQLRAYSLSFGDIVMSRKGNVGKCALFPADKPDGILHSDVLRIRVSSKKTNPCFMMCQLHFNRDIIRQIEMVSSGAIMAGVNVTKLKEILVRNPPLELQNQFAAFVSQIDKSKAVVQAALEKTQLLFDSLMQQYFG